MNIYTFGQFGKKKKRVTASMVIGKSVCRQNNTNPDFGYVKFDPQFLRKCVGGGDFSLMLLILFLNWNV